MALHPALVDLHRLVYHCTCFDVGVGRGDEPSIQGDTDPPLLCSIRGRASPAQDAFVRYAGAAATETNLAQRVVVCFFLWPLSRVPAIACERCRGWDSSIQDLAGGGIQLCDRPWHDESVNGLHAADANH